MSALPPPRPALRSRPVIEEAPAEETRGSGAALTIRGPGGYEAIVRGASAVYVVALVVIVYLFAQRVPPLLAAIDSLTISAQHAAEDAAVARAAVQRVETAQQGMRTEQDALRNELRAVSNEVGDIHRELRAVLPGRSPR